MGLNKTVSLKSILLSVLVFILLISVGYKYFEWKTLVDLVSTSNSVLVAEMSQSQKSNEFYNSEVEPLMTAVFSDKVKNNEDYIIAVDELRGKYKASDDVYKSELRLFNDDKDKISIFKSKGKFLIGKPRLFVNDFVNNTLISYDKAIQQSKTGTIENSFIDDFFMVSRDMAVSNAFSKDAPPIYNQALVKYVQNNFNKISSLEKYTRDDFKFKVGDDYKTKAPYGYDFLIKYRDYLKSYYLIMKDLAGGDIESATYKYTKFHEQSVAINVDYLKLFNETQDSKDIVHQENIEAVAKFSKTSKDFGIKKYPFVGNVPIFNSDLALCGMYVSKVALYKNINSDYPSAQSTDELIAQLSKVYPNTDFVDKDFDKSILKVISNDKKSIVTECLDKTSGKSFRNETIK